MLTSPFLCALSVLRVFVVISHSYLTIPRLDLTNHAYALLFHVISVICILYNMDARNASVFVSDIDLFTTIAYNLIIGRH